MSDWELVDVKSVKDSDGFYTDYTMWHNVVTDEWVCIFGDRDIYDPYNADYDYECDTEAECREWFDYYEGFDDDDVYSTCTVNSSTSIDNLDIVLDELGRNVSKLRKSLWNGALSESELSSIETSIYNMNNTMKAYIAKFDM